MKPFSSVYWIQEIPKFRDDKYVVFWDKVVFKLH